VDPTIRSIPPVSLASNEKDGRSTALWRNRTVLFGRDPDVSLSQVLTMESVCALGPGQGIEEDAGYKLLVDKIRRTTNTTTITSRSLRLFCGIYSHSGRRSQVQVQAATWGNQCDGWIVFSNESMTEWGIYNLSHEGAESYGNMWQKVRSIWTFQYQQQQQHQQQHHHDYFYLGGDDTYVLVDNLKDWLRQWDYDRTIPRHMGQWLPGKAMISGGPGYVLNAAALQRLVKEGLPRCFVTTKASYEDRLLSHCLADVLGIMGNQTDTRDNHGEQRFHDASPAMLYSFRASTARGSSYLARTAATWEDLPPPHNSTTQSKGARVGPKHALEAAAAYSISFHHIYNPHYMARIHAILHPHVCPPDSPLGRGLRQHLPSSSPLFLESINA